MELTRIRLETVNALVTTSSPIVQQTKHNLIPVGVKTKVLIEEVDVVKQISQFKIFVCCHFNDPNIEPWNKSELPPTPFRPCPEDVRSISLVFNDSNSVEQLEMIKLYHLQSGTVFQMASYRVQIRQMFELHRFPFDRQVLKFTMLFEIVLL